MDNLDMKKQEEDFVSIIKFSQLNILQFKSFYSIAYSLISTKIYCHFKQN